MRAPKLLAALVAAASLALPIAPAQAADTGPAYSVPLGQLARSLTCGPTAGTSGRPVLLVHGTTFTAATNWDWNYERALTAQKRAWCAVDLPISGMGDIAKAAEHVTYAIRTMSARVGGRIDVIGYSQGGMVPRWSLKYWPDTRAKVADFVGIDPSNYGTLDSYVVCATSCAPAFRQQGTGSRFLAALNAGPDTWAGIDYTVVYTVTDEVVTPNLPPKPASGLRDGAGRISQIAVQEVCPVHVADHLSMGTTDPVGWAVGFDALTHPGPAAKARIPASVCLQDVMPGVDRAQLPANVARATAQVTTAVATSPRTTSEPPLPAYAR